MTQNEINVLAKIGSESFFNDTLYTSTVKDEDKRKRFLYHLTKFRLSASNEKDIIVKNKLLRGVCVWRNKSANYTLKDILGCKSSFVLLTIYLPSLIKVLSFSSSINTKFFEENTLLIEPIFVSPKYQGKGIAKTLVQEKIKDLKAEGYQLGLVTQNVNNLKIYEKMGFTKFKEEFVEKFGITNYYMILNDVFSSPS